MSPKIAAAKSELFSISTLITVVSMLVSSCISIGAFVGVSNYRAQVQEKSFDQFQNDMKKQLTDTRNDTYKQIAELKADNNQRMDKLESRLNGTDQDSRETAKLEEQNRQLQLQVNSIRDDLKLQVLLTQGIREQVLVLRSRNEKQQNQPRPELRTTSDGYEPPKHENL